MNEIIVATGNAGKLREMREILHDLPIKITSLSDFWDPIPSIPETGATFLENALQKASWVFNQKKTWVLADDSGLEVDALYGGPGVKSARYSGELATSAQNNRKLLLALKDVSPELRTARFKCVIVLKNSLDNYFSAEGVCEGKIILTPLGSDGFGYDPLFVPDGYSQTFAELSQGEKTASAIEGKRLLRFGGIYMISFNNKNQHEKEIVLIVDDDEENTKCFRAILERAGYNAITASSGEEGIRIAGEQVVDLVLMDVIMPGMNGVIAAEKIKSIFDEEDFLPVILVTAFDSEENKIAGLACADGYITKPVSNAELLAIVRSHLKIRRLNREIIKAKDRYKGLYENFPHMYITVNPRGFITISNKLFRDTFKLSKSDVEQTTIFSLLKNDDETLFRKFLESLGQEAFAQQTFFEFCVPGSALQLKLNIKAAFTSEFEGSVAIALEDVTLRCNLEEEQKLARKQLYRSARLASIGTLASGVAHELNNPLTAILGFSSALLNRTGDTDEIDKKELGMYLQIIHNETLRCRDIVENLHRFSRENTDSSITQSSLFECIVNTLRLINMKAVRKNITIINEIDANVWVNTDIHRLEQVLLNILTNCIDFCESGALVKISGRTSNATSKFFRVSVTDNGPGMNPEVIANAFDPFFTTKEVGTGIGMGLAICHKIMEELSGRIDIFSEPGLGTTVMIEIPKYQP